MSDKVNDGGPAFPWNHDSISGEDERGLTMRDWFAGQALAGLLANPTVQEWDAEASKAGDPDLLAGVCALMAFKQADAMIAEREKKGGAE